MAYRAIYIIVREIIRTSRKQDQNSLRSSKAKPSATAIILFASRNRANSIRRHYRSNAPFDLLPLPSPPSFRPLLLFLFALGIPQSTWPRSFMPGFPGKLARHLLTSRPTSLTYEMGSFAPPLPHPPFPPYLF